MRNLGQAVWRSSFSDISCGTMSDVSSFNTISPSPSRLLYECADTVLWHSTDSLSIKEDGAVLFGNVLTGTWEMSLRLEEVGNLTYLGVFDCSTDLNEYEPPEFGLLLISHGRVIRPGSSKTLILSQQGTCFGSVSTQSVADCSVLWRGSSVKRLYGRMSLAQTRAFVLASSTLVEKLRCRISSVFRWKCSLSIVRHAQGA